MDYIPETVWGYAEGPGYEAVSGWCATKEAAAAEGRAELGLEGSGDIYVYAGTVPDPASMFDVDDIIERAAERAGDNWPECAEDWPDVSPEGLAELEAFLATWARKHAPCRFYVCNDDGQRAEATNCAPASTIEPQSTETPSNPSGK